MTVSETVHGNHNNPALEFRWGVRTELTRAYTEAAIAELLQTYPNLDGLMGAMGESMPGKRSTWYRDAVVPGILRAGRQNHPPFILFHWLMPFDDFKEDIAPPGVYGNTWLAIQHNGEGIDSVQVYPTSKRWAEKSGMPTIVQIVPHNVDGEWYRGVSPQIGSHDSPKLAYEMIDQYRHLKNCVGFNYHATAGDLNNALFKKSLGFYATNNVPYSEDPWLDLLQTEFGTRQAAEHILKAYDLSARIVPEVGALAWEPHDLYIFNRLRLPFWFFQEQNTRPKWGYFCTPAREGGLMLLPPRYYAWTLVRNRSLENHNGSEIGPGHWSQEFFWGHIDFQVLPKTHMATVRDMGRECREEMEAALPHVTTNQAKANISLHYMKSHELLTQYYEHKVSAAIHALAYKFGAGSSDRSTALSQANLAVADHEAAINYIITNIDENRNLMRSKWGNEGLTLTQIKAAERADRDNIATLFQWP